MDAACGEGRGAQQTLRGRPFRPSRRAQAQDAGTYARINGGIVRGVHMPRAPLHSEDDRLLRAARAARRRAYAPYSHFPVGAAVLASDGSIYAGANVENVSFGLTQCAERVAIQSAVAAGRRRLRTLAVAGRDGISPCGACRQVMAEFGIETVLLAGPRGAATIVPLTTLLPRPFAPARLGGRRAAQSGRPRAGSSSRRAARRRGVRVRRAGL